MPCLPPPDLIQPQQNCGENVPGDVQLWRYACQSHDLPASPHLPGTSRAGRGGVREGGPGQGRSGGQEEDSLLLDTPQVHLFCVTSHSDTCVCIQTHSVLWSCVVLHHTAGQNF